MLHITKENIFIGTLIELIKYLPNLTSLIVSSLEMIYPRHLNAEEVKTLQKISKENKITRAKLEHVFDLSEVHFLLQLCPSVQYFEMNCGHTNVVIKVIRFILMKNKKYIPNLSTLCLQTNQTDIVMNGLKKIIDLEQLCLSYTIEQINDKIYLKYIR